MSASTLRIALTALLVSVATTVNAEWYFNGQESAFDVPGTYSILNENDQGYAISAWCQPEGLFLIFDTTEVLDVADVPEAAKISYVLLFRTDDKPVRYYAGDVRSVQRHLRVEVYVDTVALNQLAAAKSRVAIAIQTPFGISHEQNFDVDGLSGNANKFLTSCKLATS